jgi:hypothetical protein
MGPIGYLQKIILLIHDGAMHIIGVQIGREFFHQHHPHHHQCLKFS